MKILVMSDSHSSLRYMRLAAEKVAPDCIIHLGDYYDDGEVIKEEYPEAKFYQVPGNCDMYRVPPNTPEIRIERIGGVDLYFTHGHRHRVKQDIAKLLQDARTCQVQAVLYGHTHIANCYQENDGLWVMNPGTCGYYGGSVGVIETNNGKIVNCRILRQENLEEMQ